MLGDMYVRSVVMLQNKKLIWIAISCGLIISKKFMTWNSLSKFQALVLIEINEINNMIRLYLCFVFDNVLHLSDIFFAQFDSFFTAFWHPFCLRPLACRRPTSRFSPPSPKFKKFKNWRHTTFLIQSKVVRYEKLVNLMMSAVCLFSADC